MLIEITDEIREEMSTEIVQSREQQLIEQVRAAPDNPLPSCSTSERITVALALEDPHLLPSGWQDTLTAYMIRLDDRQRRIVDQQRGW